MRWVVLWVVMLGPHWGPSLGEKTAATWACAKAVMLAGGTVVLKVVWSVVLWVDGKACERVDQTACV